MEPRIVTVDDPRTIEFFSRDTELRPEIIQGLIRETQIVAFGGDYGVGKSPLQAGLTIHLVHGIAWCGCEVQQRPVIAFDFETPGPTYKRNITNIAKHQGVRVPLVPDELDPYLELGSRDERGTARLLEVLKSKRIENRFGLIREALDAKPNALVFIDPVEMLFRIDTREKPQILWLYSELRILLSEYPTAAIVLTFNLRKWDKRTVKANLLSGPRDWLQEVCGSNDILNRCDVRLGMDFFDEEIRVINGIRRGEDMHPLLVRPVGDEPSNLAGFELVPPDKLNLRSTLTTKQLEHWRNLPREFRFDEGAQVVPKASLSRLLARARSLGVVDERDGLYRKLA